MTGPEVAKLRKRLGASPDEMAQLLGVTLATVYKWEKKRGELPALGHAQVRLLSLIDAKTPTKVGANRLMTALRTGTWLSAWRELLASK